MLQFAFRPFWPLEATLCDGRAGAGGRRRRADRWQFDVFGRFRR